MDCPNCGHEGCNGQECRGPFVVTTTTGDLRPDCAICCREILAGEDHALGELAAVAAIFDVLHALTP